MNRYEVDKKLGEGAFGVVYLCRRRDTDHRVVQKDISLTGMKKLEIDKLMEEVKVLEKFRESPHRNIIEGKGHIHLDDILYIYMEYCERGSLAADIEHRQNKKQLYEEKTILDYTYQIASGLDHMHQHLVIHRDLKPANILITQDGILKLADFGLGVLLNSETSLRASLVGTPLYMPPEIIKEEAYNLSCDIWAFGTILYELMVLQPAFEARNQHAALMRIVAGDHNPLDNCYSTVLNTLVKLMLVLDASKRPIISSIRALRFLSNRKVDSSSVIELEALSRKTVQDSRDIVQPTKKLNVASPRSAEKKEPTIAEVWQAVYDGNLPRLQQLLEDSSNEQALMNGLHETNMWMKRTTPVMAAVYQGHDHVVRWIVTNKKGDMDKKGVISGGGREIEGMTALLIACHKGHLGIVEMLIDEGRADINAVDEEGRTCLMYAAVGGHCDVIRALIRRGKRLGDRNKYGKTALHCAAVGGKVEAIDLLISEGTDVNVKTNKQSTPLHIAAQNGHPSAILTLLRHCAHIEARNDQQNTPLCMAALNGHVDAIKVLLEKGADIDVKGFQKRTLLHYAAEEGQTSVISFLLEKGCAITDKDQDGRTPFAIAKHFKHPSAILLLKR